MFHFERGRDFRAAECSSEDVTLYDVRHHTKAKHKNIFPFVQVDVYEDELNSV